MHRLLRGQPTVTGWLGVSFSILLALPTLCQVASADTLTLKDGGTYEGRVTEKTNDYVVFEVTSGGMLGSLRVETAKIASLTSSSPESAQLLETFRQKQSAAEEANTAAAFGDLAQWAQENKLYDKAAASYQQARKIGPDAKGDFGLAAAQNLALAGELRPARTLLKDLAVKYPDDPRIAAEQTRLDQQAQRQVDQMIRQALDSYRKGDVRQAVGNMENLQRLDIEDLVARADIAANQQSGMSFGRLLADARLHQLCPNCNQKMQSGLLACPNCNGTGKISRTRVETETTKDPKTGQEFRRTYQVDYQAVCPTCKGFTTIACPVCHGGGVDLGTVGPVEQPFVAAGLRKRIDALYEKLAGVAAEPSSLHPINLEAVHLHACRLRYYMQQYANLSPELAGTELTTLADRRMHVDNLFRHTTALYRNRELKEFNDCLKTQLLDLARKEGILNNDDLDYHEPAEVSSTKPAAKP
jgi:hypothetical protein